MCIFIPLIVGAICALLGYLLGKLLGGNNNLHADYDNQLRMNSKLKSDYDAQAVKLKSIEADLAKLKKEDTDRINNIKDESIHYQAELVVLNDKIKALNTELDACKSSKTNGDGATTALGLAAGVGTVATSNLQPKLTELETENSALKLRISELESATTSSSVAAELPFDEEAAKLVFGKKIVKDDLKIVEGIGPKIEELYHAAGIKTWKQLSETSEEKSLEILATGGDRFAMHKPSTWAKQALLANEGKWQELKDWQDQLDGGL